MELWKTEAFKRWWDQDWSWDGLQQKYRKAALARLSEPAKVSLQQYWSHARSPSFNFAGRTWTRFHLPPFDPRGNSCDEGLWNRAKNDQAWHNLALDLAQKSSEFWRANGGSGTPAQFLDLSGVVFPPSFKFASKMQAMAGDFTSAIFMRSINIPKQTIAIFSGAIFCEASEFKEAVLTTGQFDATTFLGTTNFQNTSFGDEASFVGSVFEEGANFSHARFNKGADFTSVVSSELVFDSAHFERAKFDHAKLKRPRFKQVNFRNHASFSGAEIEQGNLDQAQFGQTAVFTAAKFFGDTNLSNVAFNGNASFEQAVFDGRLACTNCTFAQGVECSGATFVSEVNVQGTRFAAAARFDSSRFLGPTRLQAVFNGDCSFNNTEFVEVEFSHSQFRGAVTFTMARFHDTARFRGATFAQPTSLHNSKFDDTADFTDAKFESETSFEGAQFSGEALFTGKAEFSSSVSFNESRFCDIADFSNCNFHDSTEFTAAWFQGIPKFDGTVLHVDTNFQGAVFHRGSAPIDRSWFATKHPDGSGWQKFRRALLVHYQHILASIACLPIFVMRWPGMGRIRRARDHATRRYERAYNVLKHLCAEIGDIEQQTRFQALELQAHRARDDAQLSDRLASVAYGVLSNYGQSMSRPIAWLVITWITVVGVYFLLFMPPYETDLSDVACKSIVAVADGTWASVEEVTVAVGRQFLPSLFGTGSGAASPPDWLRCASASRALPFFLVGVAQTLLFITCVSLFLVALRRRFKLRDQ